MTSSTENERTVIVAFEIDGDPVPKGRPRAARIGNSIRMYTDRKTQAWETIVARFTGWAMSGLPTPLIGPLTLDATFFLPRPKTVKDEYPVTNRADVDNLLKALLDGMQAAGLFRDDKQFVDVVARKRYADLRHPGVVVEVARLHM